MRNLPFVLALAVGMWIFPSLRYRLIFQGDLLPGEYAGLPLPWMAQGVVSSLDTVVFVLPLCVDLACYVAVAALLWKGIEIGLKRCGKRGVAMAVKTLTGLYGVAALGIVALSLSIGSVRLESGYSEILRVFDQIEWQSLSWELGV